MLRESVNVPMGGRGIYAKKKCRAERTAFA